MKKIFGISLVAVLAALPMVANAAAGDVNKDPVQATTEALVSAATPDENHQPKYATMNTGANDGAAATAGYVKGAYNALVKGINAVDDEVTYVQGLKSDLDSSLDDMAIRKGVMDTLGNAKVTESIQTSSVEVSSLVASSVTGSISANQTVDIPVAAVGEWGSDELLAVNNRPKVTATITGSVTAGTGTVAYGDSSTSSGSVTMNNHQGNVSAEAYYTAANTTGFTGPFNDRSGDI